jgi:quercetin dioxygenase-like cupin family protein
LNDTDIQFTNPDGERLIIRKTGKSTGGELLEMEAVYMPASPQPPYHYHPYQEEQFEVLAGVFRAMINDVEYTYQTGDKFTVPANIPHWMHNISPEEGRLLWQIRPALKSQEFFETMWGLLGDDKTNANGVPNLLQLAVILLAYRNEFRASRPPYPVQRILFSLLAPLGWLLGYRARYARYSDHN